METYANKLFHDSIQFPRTIPALFPLIFPIVSLMLPLIDLDRWLVAGQPRQDATGLPRVPLRLLAVVCVEASEFLRFWAVIWTSTPPHVIH